MTKQEPPLRLTPYSYEVTMRGPIDVWTGWYEIREWLNTAEDDREHLDYIRRYLTAISLAIHAGLDVDDITELRVAGREDAGDCHALLCFAFKVSNNGTVTVVQETGYTSWG
jgi:hypothetical protein